MKINEYLDQPNVYEGDLQLEKLLEKGMDSTLAKSIWESIANGSADVAVTLIWAKIVAQQICNDVFDSDTGIDKSPAALKAIGHWGRVDNYAAAEDLMQTYSNFDEHDEHGNPLPPKRWTAKEWLHFIQRNGLLLDVNEKTAINEINKLRGKLGIK